MSGGPHKYGTGVNYGTHHKYGEVAEIYQADTQIIGAGAGDEGWGEAGWGVDPWGGGGPAYPTMTAEAAATVSFTAESGAAAPAYTAE